jgi:hypothetical protein
LSSSIEQAAPSFVGSQHDGRTWKNLGAGGAKLETQCGKRNCDSARSQDVLIYPPALNRFACLHRTFVRTAFGVVNGQAHLSSPEQAPYQDPRVSYAHGNQMGTCSTQPSPQKGTEESHRQASEQVRRRVVTTLDFRAATG